MAHILVTTKVYPRHVEQLRAAARDCEFVFTQEPSDEQIQWAEVLFGNVPVVRLKDAKNLKLVQLQTAGVGEHRALCSGDRDIRLCTASGAYGLAIAEHIFGVLLGLQKRLFAYHDQQASGTWKDLGMVRSLYGANVLVIGMGDIGGEFAKRCKAFGASVTGIRRSLGTCPEYCDAVGVQADADQYIPQADIVFLCMPETEQTRRFMNRERIARMKPGAILLNAGRGSAIDTDALVDAIREGRLFGAGMDVTDPEPLPQDHPLWRCGNVCITPHVSGGLHLEQTHDRIVSIACENLRAYLEKAPLRNEVNYERGY